VFLDHIRDRIRVFEEILLRDTVYRAIRLETWDKKNVCDLWAIKVDGKVLKEKCDEARTWNALGNPLPLPYDWTKGIFL
jgi:hypothetical protein